MSKELKNYDDALDWLFNDLASSGKSVFDGESSIRTAASLMAELGNPQNDYRTVHVAGTSGKGSTTALISAMLEASGQRTGAIFSPHVYDFRERFLIGGKLVEKDEVLEAAKRIKPIIESLNSRQIFPNYYQSVVALAYVIFANHELDYLVVETGFGGLYDTTNLIERQDKVAVLNSIGLDHTEILGDSLEKIARQKAGIISKGSVVFALKQSREVNQVFEREAELRGASDFHFVTPLNLDGGATRQMNKNGALSLAVCKYLAERDDWGLADHALSAVIKDFQLPGRLEIRKVGGRVIILDGAHNAQKIGSLVESVRAMYPGKKFNVLFAVSKKRSPDEMLSLLMPITEKFYLTSYELFKNDPKRKSLDFSKYDNLPEGAQVVDNPKAALELLENSAQDWLVTGSFFIVSEIGKKL